MCKIIMERSMNEQWECDQETGEMILCGFISDGGASNFEGYYCEEHAACFDNWREVLAHMKNPTGVATQV